jgi:hypothetical protein
MPIVRPYPPRLPLPVGLDSIPNRSTPVFPSPDATMPTVTLLPTDEALFEQGALDRYFDPNTRVITERMPVLHPLRHMPTQPHIPNYSPYQFFVRALQQRQTTVPPWLVFPHLFTNDPPVQPTLKQALKQLGKRLAWPWPPFKWLFNPSEAGVQPHA